MMKFYLRTQNLSFVYNLHRSSPAPLKNVIAIRSLGPGTNRPDLGWHPADAAQTSGHLMPSLQTQRQGDLPSARPQRQRLVWGCRRTRTHPLHLFPGVPGGGGPRQRLLDLCSTLSVLSSTLVLWGNGKSDSEGFWGLLPTSEPAPVGPRGLHPTQTQHRPPSRCAGPAGVRGGLIGLSGPSLDMGRQGLWFLWGREAGAPRRPQGAAARGPPSRQLKEKKTVGARGGGKMGTPACPGLPASSVCFKLFWVGVGSLHPPTPGTAGRAARTPWGPQLGLPPRRGGRLPTPPGASSQGLDPPPMPAEGAGAAHGNLWPNQDVPEELAAALEYSSGPGGCQRL